MGIASPNRSCGGLAAELQGRTPKVAKIPETLVKPQTSRMWSGCAANAGAVALAIILLIATGACATSKSTEHDPRRNHPLRGKRIVPAELFRQAAAGADRLELLPPVGDQEPFLVVSDPAAINELLAAVQTPPFVVGSDGGCTCVAPSIAVLYRGKEPIVTFAFIGLSLRVGSPNLWGWDEPPVTLASAHAIEEWFHRHGAPDYHDLTDRFMQKKTSPLREK
jgi:hypothetical protein